MVMATQVPVVKTGGKEDLKNVVTHMRSTGRPKGLQLAQLQNREEFRGSE